MIEKYEDLTDKLQKSLSKERFLHTLGVANCAACLGMTYGISFEKCYLAGLLHDCAKGYSKEENYQIALEAKLEMSDVQVANKDLLHSLVGAYLAKENYGITDEEILSAIKYHTTGKPGMTLLEKIIFTADYIELNRDRAPRLDEIRKMAFTDLNKAIVMIYEDTLAFLKGRKGEIDGLTVESYNYYLKGENE